MFNGCKSFALPIRFGNKWTGKILLCLRDDRRRFSELQTALQGITPKVLAESLRALERDGFVSRTSYPEVPPRVEYELTDLGRSLLEPMAALCRWTEAHLTELLAERTSV